MYKMDRSRYRKLIEEKENNVLEGKDPFLNTVSGACKVLSSWENRYGNKETRLTKVNNDMAFMTTGIEEKKGNKKKEVTFYKCGKSGHYSNKYDEVEAVKMSNTSNTNKKRSNFLIFKNDPDYSSSEENAVDDITEDPILEEQGPGTNTDTDTDEEEELNRDEDDEDTEEEEPDEESNDYDDDDDTDDDYEVFAFLPEDIMCSLQDKQGISGKLDLAWQPIISRHIL